LLKELRAGLEKGLQGAAMNVKITTGGVALLTILFMVVGGCAMQEDVAAVNTRLMTVKRNMVTQDREAESERDSLRSEIAQCREAQEKSDEAYRTKYAELHALMKDLKEDIQGVDGRLEESGHEAQQCLDALPNWEAKQEDRWKELEKELQSNLDRIVRLEQYLGMEPSEKLVSSEPEDTGSNQETTSEEKTPDALYGLAKKKFDQGEYEDAGQLFQAFLQQYPKSDNADSAQFWIGEIYYREKWYEKAILEYQKVIEDHPNGNKVQSALLKQGFAFSNLGDADNAKLILKELVRKYPDSNEAKIAQKKLKTFQ
jgi:tol-pal system protein YbgF